MKNYGIIKFQYANRDNFTSDFGMNARKIINIPLRKIFKIATKGELIIDSYPKLEKGQNYIFVSIHNFVEDTIANLATIDRDAYLLFGTTDQLEINKEMYAAWLNGFIYVDRYNPESRKESVLKMKRVLSNGNSVILFPEGGFNNTENLLCQKLFAGPYVLAKETGLKVVPIAPFNEFGSKQIYMNVGEPLDLAKYDSKEEALQVLRDTFATMLYESIEKYTKPIKRHELGKKPRLDYMEQRKIEYQKTNWTKDVWDEELTIYRDKDDKEYLDMLMSFEKINVTPQNVHSLLPTLKLLKELYEYDFKAYMHENWMKK